MSRVLRRKGGTGGGEEGEGLSWPIGRGTLLEQLGVGGEGGGQIAGTSKETQGLR